MLGKLKKINVVTEATQRETELAKKERAKLTTRIDNELLEIKKIVLQAERKSMKAEETALGNKKELVAFKQQIQSQLDQLKEPLATEVKKMVWENKHLHDQFDN